MEIAVSGKVELPHLLQIGNNVLKRDQENVTTKNNA